MDGRTESKMSDNKKKKEKYYDDGRTIADMSALYGKKSTSAEGDEPEYRGDPGLFGSYRAGHTPKDWAKTYWQTVKLMFVPMLITMGVISVAFLILWIILTLAS